MQPSTQELLRIINELDTTQNVPRKKKKLQYKIQNTVACPWH